jgi:RHS repeat-associated protein
LIGVEQTSDGVNILLAVTYTYDAHDKLVAEEKWQSSTGVVATRRHWDGEDLWAITDASNVVAARYLYGEGVDQVQGRIVEAGPNAGTQGFYATDHLGSVRDIIDAATGEVLYHAEYDAFGAATEYGAGYGDRLKYTARELDADTGLQYNRARWYDNSVGRWLSEDPIGFAAGDHNLYRYVSNFATGATDPSGKFLVGLALFPLSEEECRKILKDQAEAWEATKQLLASKLLKYFLEGYKFQGKKRDIYTGDAQDKAELKERAKDSLRCMACYGIKNDIGWFAKPKVGSEVFFDSKKHGHVRYWSTDFVGTVGIQVSPISNLTEHVFFETGLFNAFGGVDVAFKGKVMGIAGEEVLVAGDAVFSDYYTFEYNFARQSFIAYHAAVLLQQKYGYPAFNVEIKVDKIWLEDVYFRKNLVWLGQ